MYWSTIIGFAALGVIWIVSEPTQRLKSLYKRNDWFMRLINCAMCSTWHLYFWCVFIMNGTPDLLGASISAVLAEFITRKINSGSL